MTVVAAYLYRNGHRVRAGVDRRADRLRAADKSEFVWIGVAEPTAEEMENGCAKCSSAFIPWRWRMRSIPISFPRLKPTASCCS